MSLVIVAGTTRRAKNRTTGEAHAARKKKRDPSYYQVRSTYMAQTPHTDYNNDIAKMPSKNNTDLLWQQ